jgi:hypothetical protein
MQAESPLVALLPILLAWAILSFIAAMSPTRYGVYFATFPLLGSAARLRIFFALNFAGSAFEFLRVLAIRWHTVAGWNWSTVFFACVIFAVTLGFSVIVHIARPRVDGETLYQTSHVARRGPAGADAKTLIPLFIIVTLGGLILIRIHTSPPLQHRLKTPHVESTR